MSSDETEVLSDAFDVVGERLQELEGDREDIETEVEDLTKELQDKTTELQQVRAAELEQQQVVDAAYQDWKVAFDAAEDGFELSAKSQYAADKYGI